MHPDLRRLLTALRSGQAILGIVAILPPLMATYSAYTKGLPFHQLILVGHTGVLLFLASIYVILLLGDRLISGLESIREGRRVATLLEESASVGNTQLTINNLVNIWLEQLPANATIRAIKQNVMLRTLKGAVRQGLIERVGDQEESVNSKTLCRIESAAKFFRDRKWLDVEEVHRAVAAPTMTSGTAPLNLRRLRKNWVNNWRR